MEIHERIRQARLEVGITQKAMARHLGMSRVNYNYIEAGKVRVTADLVVQIEKILNKKI